MYLAAAVGGDRWGRWAVLQGRGAVGMELERGVPCVLRVLEMVSEYLDLLVTGVCSHEKSASGVSSSSQLQWSHGERKQGKQRGQ